MANLEHFPHKGILQDCTWKTALLAGRMTSSSLPYLVFTSYISPIQIRGKYEMNTR